MKSKFATIIITMVILLNVVVIGIFIIIAVQELKGIEASEQVENFVTDFSKITSDNNLAQNIETPKIIQNPLDEIEMTSSNIQNIEYTNINVNKHFYNQLEDYSKTIYKAFESNKENMKTGTYKIELGTSFSSILSQQNGQELLGEYYQSAIEAYTYDNPDVFYLSPNKMYLNIETTTRGKNVTYNVYINAGNEVNYLSDEFNTKEQVDLAIAKLESVRNAIIQNKKANTYENIKMVHDYLIETIEYDNSISKENIYNIYGALINKECVCEGYAKSFKYLMDGLNIPCSIIIGKGTNTEGTTENHAWNYVQINEKWYALDITWDDPIIIGIGNIGNKRKYKYFLLGSQEFNVDHMPIGKFTQNGKEFSYPELSTENYSK